MAEGKTFEASSPPPEYSPYPSQPDYPQGQPGYFLPEQPGYPQGQPGYPQVETGYQPQKGGYPGGYPQGVTGPSAYHQSSTAVVVTQPVPNTTYVGYAPNDNMLMSILTCIFCAWPCGIAAIVFSCKSKDARERRDYPAAVQYASSARKWAIAAIVCGIIIIGINLIYRFAFAASTYK